MRAMVLAGAVLAAASVARAADAPPAPAVEPVCTTTTTVVKRGEAVLSSNTTTKCDDEGRGAFLPSIDVNAGGVVKSLLGSSGPQVTAVKAGGAWRSVGGARLPCQLDFTHQAGDQGYRVRIKTCTPPLAAAAYWRLEEGTVGLYDGAGALIVRLGGDHERLSGTSAAGARIVLQR